MFASVGDDCQLNVYVYTWHLLDMAEFSDGTHVILDLNPLMDSKPINPKSMPSHLHPTVNGFSSLDQAIT